METKIWNYSKNEWYKGLQNHRTVITLDGTILEVYEDSCENAIREPDDSLKIVRSIGITYPNGVSIYEGDIVRQIKEINGNFIDRIIENFEVVWQGTGFQYKPVKDTQYKQYTVTPFSGVEKLGTIFENPELWEC